MKKLVLLLLGSSAFFISCSNETVALSGQEDQKTEAMQNFKKAVIIFNQPGNLPTAEEKRGDNYSQLNDRRLDLLVPASENLIKSTGIKSEDIVKSTNGNKDLIVEWALRIFNSNSNN
jgi:hypothetical protein